MEEKIVSPEEIEEEVNEDQKMEQKVKNFFGKPKQDQTSLIDLVLAAMQMQQETIIEQQKTISIYARQSTSYEQATQSHSNTFDINSLAPLIQGIIQKLMAGGPQNG